MRTFTETEAFTLGYLVNAGNFRGNFFRLKGHALDMPTLQLIGRTLSPEAVTSYIPDPDSRYGYATLLRVPRAAAEVLLNAVNAEEAASRNPAAFIRGVFERHGTASVYSNVIMTASTTFWSGLISEALESLGVSNTYNFDETKGTHKVRVRVYDLRKFYQAMYGTSASTGHRRKNALRELLQMRNQDVTLDVGSQQLLTERLDRLERAETFKRVVVSSHILLDSGMEESEVASELGVSREVVETVADIFNV